MSLNIYLSSYNLIIFKSIIDSIFSFINISFRYINNYDENIDIILRTKYDYDNNDEIKLKNNYTILNKLKNISTLTNKDLIIDFKWSPYSFIILFNDKKYDKKIIEYHIKSYKYDKNFGNDYWILKNPQGYQSIGTFLLTTEELYNLNNNYYFINELKKFPSKTYYIVQKYLENPIIHNNKKYDIRVHLFLISNFNKETNTLTYKFYLYNRIFAQLTSIDYDVNITDLKSHLTNDNIQNEDLSIDLLDIVLLDVHNKILNESRVILKKYIKHKKFIEKIKLINTYPYVYQIFGVDFLLDKNYKLYLIDMNSNPGLDYKKYDSNSLTDNIITIMLKCIIMKIIKVFDKYKNFLNTDEKINNYLKLKKIYDFNKNFKFITKIETII